MEAYIDMFYNILTAFFFFFCVQYLEPNRIALLTTPQSTDFDGTPIFFSVHFTRFWMRQVLLCCAAFFGANAGYSRHAQDKSINLCSPQKKNRVFLFNSFIFFCFFFFILFFYFYFYFYCRDEK